MSALHTERTCGLVVTFASALPPGPLPTASVTSTHAGLFATLSAAPSSSGGSGIELCVETSAEIDLQCYTTNVTAVVTVELSQPAVVVVDVLIQVGLTEWSHYGGPPTPASYLSKMAALHRKWDSRLSFGQNQTMVLFDAGWWNANEAAAEKPTNPPLPPVVVELNREAISQWKDRKSTGDPRTSSKLVAAFDPVNFENPDLGDTADFGHGENIFALVAGKPVFSRAGAASTIGLAFNANVALVRGFVGKDCHVEPDAEEYSKNARWTKEMLKWTIANRELLGITHVHISTIEGAMGEMGELEEYWIFDEELEELKEKGVTVVAPAGNNCAGGTRVNYPGAHPGIISVGVMQPPGAGGKGLKNPCYGDGLDLVIRSSAHTSSSSAYASAYFMMLQEAIEKWGVPWRGLGMGEALQDVVLAILRETGAAGEGGLGVAQIDAALDWLWERGDGWQGGVGEGWGGMNRIVE
ncbi:hypothetical protein TeGR_g1937 [Tetraparma gracilis]|uniref:subtilisin n=1 Tax=Tetraparma gracilis TaxID=2962635 RepID=A0ABQ6N5L0_9STRA|nr:hypothetical protein TeGR_g1937 [Tetraparma gracilis]